jgi:hypothetical protein
MRQTKQIDFFTAVELAENDALGRCKSVCSRLRHAQGDLDRITSSHG